ncbi:MAG: 3-isopropylmalate dehydratase small subunit [Cenarchaeum symbiont of Oopsacas minuta]|nr:3-isopropylmalate dehydratase small subunit [Cenarchaeum symbiont of Oopsacas minuta]
MKPFKTVSGIVTPLNRTNVDTDQIIPKQFLKSTERTGFGKNLFYGWRYDSKGTPIIEFVLNNPKYANSPILVAGENFGCGSSREHAVWAILDHGFLVVIAPSFADIFFNNCIKNGILPVKLDTDLVSNILEAKSTMIDVDLKSQTLIINSDGANIKISFEIDTYAKNILLQGLDEISITMKNEKEISLYENSSKIRPIEGLT